MTATMSEVFDIHNTILNLIEQYPGINHKKIHKILWEQGQISKEYKVSWILHRLYDLERNGKIKKEKIVGGCVGWFVLEQQE
jgi:hypothetical protein